MSTPARAGDFRARAGSRSLFIGTFLADLAVNAATRDSEAKHELEFIGSHLFIPVFFITIGFLIELRTFASTLVTHFWLLHDGPDPDGAVRPPVAGADNRVSVREDAHESGAAARSGTAPSRAGCGRLASDRVGGGGGTQCNGPAGQSRLSG